MNQREIFLSRLVAIDTETTGKDYTTCEVIEMGVAYRANGEYVQESQLYRPDADIGPGCSAVTNITNRMVKDCDSFVNHAAAWQTKIFEIVPSDEIIAVAHNSYYDMRVLERYGVNMPRWLCTWKISKKLFANTEAVEATNLPYLRYFFDVDVSPSSVNHRAGTDCEITLKVLENMLDFMEATGEIDTGYDYFDQINDWLNRPVLLTTVPFGKHKGKSFDEVPLDYWDWALKNFDSLNENSDQYDPNLAASVIAAVEKQLG